MAIPKFLVDLAIISKLGEYPGSDNGLSTAQFKAKFDEAALRIKEYLNTVLIPELDKIIDVDALLADILDTSLTKSDKAAPAKTVGEKLLQMNRSHASFFSQAIKSGDYILDADQNFKTELLTVNKIRVYGGKYVTQGNLVELNLGSYVDLDIPSGGVGLYRHDLICARYERNADGNVTNSIVLVQGNSVQETAVDPVVNTGDINSDGAVVHDTVLCRVILSETTVSTKTLMWAQGNRTFANGKVVTLVAANWSGNTQTVEVAGVTADEARCHVIACAAESTREAYNDAVVRCTGQGEGTLTFVCDDTPAVDVVAAVLILA